MNKIKIMLLIGVSFALITTNFNSLAKANDIKNFTDNYQQLLSEANSIYKKYYEPESLSINPKDVLESQNNRLEQKELNNVFYAAPDESKQYWQIAINKIYLDLPVEQKQALSKINYEVEDFNVTFSILLGEDSADIFEEGKMPENENSSDFSEQVKKIGSKIKKLVGAGAATLAFSIISSMVSGISAASWIPFAGWAVAAVLIASLIIFVVANWSYIKDSFDNFMSSLKRSNPRISNLLSEASDKAKEEAKDNPDVSKDATSQNQMQKQVERGQAPKEVDRVDRAHNEYGQPHVHFKDGTSINRDGTVHDKGHGVPNISQKVWDWLHRNGWCQNGLKR